LYGKNKRNLTLRVRYKDGFNVRSRLVVGNQKRAARSLGKGKILRVEKVSKNELYHMGEYNDMPNRLMNEFKNGKKNGGGGDAGRLIDDMLCSLNTEQVK